MKDTKPLGSQGVYLIIPVRWDINDTRFDTMDEELDKLDGQVLARLKSINSIKYYNEKYPCTNFLGWYKGIGNSCVLLI